jgi:hypothetical protein
MKNKMLTWMGRGVVLAAASSGFTLALADAGHPPPAPVHYTGLINDYTPSAAVVKNGPYEMRGKWTLDVDPRRGTARFSAAMNMETSDFGTSETVVNAQGVSQPLVNKDDPTTRSAHTHHILMAEGTVSADWSACPVFNPPITGGFVVTGPVLITGNGSPAPFGNPSTLTLCVLGGTPTAGSAIVVYSNITLSFSAPANTHFGKFPIHGVVLNCAAPWEFQSPDCTVQD